MKCLAKPKRTMTYSALIGAACLCAVAFSGAALAQNYDLDWWTIDGGGDMFSTGGDFELSGTIGQPDANTVVMTGGNFELTGGFWPVAVSAPPPACPGDFNCDGKRDFDDIDPFVAALSSGQCACPNFANCDLNGDGKITFDDIDPFIAVLGVPCP